MKKCIFRRKTPFILTLAPKPHPTHTLDVNFTSKKNVDPYSFAKKLKKAQIIFINLQSADNNPFVKKSKDYRNSNKILSNMDMNPPDAEN